MAGCGTCAAEHVKWEDSLWYEDKPLFLCQKCKDETLKNLKEAFFKVNGRYPRIENWVPYAERKKRYGYN